MQWLGCKGGVSRHPLKPIETCASASGRGDARRGAAVPAFGPGLLVAQPSRAVPNPLRPRGSHSSPWERGRWLGWKGQGWKQDGHRGGNAVRELGGSWGLDGAGCCWAVQPGPAGAWGRYSPWGGSSLPAEPLKAAGGRELPSGEERSRPVAPLMRLPSMSQPFLLAPIAECSPGPPGAQVRLAVLGARGVGKSGEWGGAGLSSLLPLSVRPSLPCPSVPPNAAALCFSDDRAVPDQAVHRGLRAQHR